MQGFKDLGTSNTWIAPNEYLECINNDHRIEQKQSKKENKYSCEICKIKWKYAKE